MASSASTRMSDGSTRLAARWSCSADTEPNRLREDLSQHRQRLREVRQAATDPVLPQPALRLVEAQRQPVPQRRARELGPDAVLVHGVPRLVHHGPQGGPDVGRLVASGDPQVAGGDGHGEGVNGFVEAALVLWDRQARQHPLCQLALVGEGEIAVQAARVGCLRRGEALNQRLKPVPQRREHGLELARAHAGLVVVQQHVVGVLVGREALHVLTGELDVPLQVGEEGGEVRCLAGLHPRLLAPRGRAGQLGAERGGHAARLVDVAAGNAHQARVVGVRRLVRDLLGGALEQVGQLVVDHQLVPDRRERGELVAARLAAALRHLGPLIPRQQRSRAGQIGDRGQPFLCALQSSCHAANLVSAAPQPFFAFGATRRSACRRRAVSLPERSLRTTYRGSSLDAATTWPLTSARRVSRRRTTPSTVWPRKFQLTRSPRLKSSGIPRSLSRSRRPTPAGLQAPPPLIPCPGVQGEAKGLRTSRDGAEGVGVAEVPRYDGPFGAAQAERLLWRAAFGGGRKDAEKLAEKGMEGAVRSLTRPRNEDLKGPPPTDGRRPDQAERPLRARRPLGPGSHGPLPGPGAGADGAHLARLVRDRRRLVAEALDQAVEALPQARPRQLPRAGPRGHDRPRDARLALGHRQPQGLAERELRTRAHGALHARRGRRRLSRTPRTTSASRRGPSPGGRPPGATTPAT